MLFRVDGTHRPLRFCAQDGGWTGSTFPPASTDSTRIGTASPGGGQQQKYKTQKKTYANNFIPDQERKHIQVRSFYGPLDAEPCGAAAKDSNAENHWPVLRSLAADLQGQRDIRRRCRLDRWH